MVSVRPLVMAVFCFGSLLSAEEALRPESEAASPPARRSSADSNPPEDDSPVLLRRHESLVIVGGTLDPAIERRNDGVYRDSLFPRDDQLFHTLDAGINAGQHEGGGKSVEIRRFGFNLDHGGVGGGLKVLVDNVQQNQGTHGHGQGYLGALKGVTPELIDNVDVLNGPFDAQYGDFSGLGVVHVRLKERLAAPLSLRLQAGNFESFRGFAAWSPRLDGADAFLAYEGSRTDGPFLNPLAYARDNLTLSYTRRLRAGAALGLRLAVNRNDFTSSGQIPLDEVEAGRLDRFGFVDPDNGGRGRSATMSLHYRRPLGGSGLLKADAFVSRSLFDIYSNFTFFRNDEANGDEIQQHDSRLQEGASLQFLRAHRLFGRSAVLVAGGSLHASQIRVSLEPTVARRPIGVSTDAHADVTNAAGYLQEGVNLWGGRLHIEAGLRFDHFRFAVDDFVDPSGSGARGAARFQPKAGLAITPSLCVPLRLHLNYGRGISSQDARGVVRDPSGPKISATDVYQVGLSASGRTSLAADLFLVDRSNEQIYIPDDGRLEFKGPSRAYGFEVKASTVIARGLSLNGGLTRVIDAFYRGTSPRVYVDKAPHAVVNVGLTLSEARGWSGSLRFRHASDYRLDGEDASVRASGLRVLDLSVARRLGSRATLIVAVDNLTGAAYYETQNYFESRLRPGDPVVARIHASPGYPRTFAAGVTLELPRRY